MVLASDGKIAVAHVEINKAAPVIGISEMFISAPIETVWLVLADLPSWPRWNKTISSLQMGGPLAVGTSFVWVAGGAKIRSKLREVDAPRKIAWSGKTLGIRAIHVWTLDTNGAGTNVYTEESYEGILPRIFPRLMKKTLVKALEQGLEALKLEAESQHNKRV